MVRILHAADLHLDASFASVGLSSSSARKHREKLRDALVRILTLAQEQKVQAVTFAGDLYEQERFSRDTGKFLVSQFQRISPIKVLIAPGNHDPWLPESLYQYLQWPENVTIFTSPEFTPVHLSSQHTLWGMAHPTPSYRKNPLENFRVPAQGTHLLLFHGSDISAVPAGKTAHAPFRSEQVEASGAALALLGHYHRGKLAQAGKAKLFYPGSPEPLSFDEDDPHTVGLITLTDLGSSRPVGITNHGSTALTNQEVDVAQIPINSCRFLVGEVDITGAGSREEVKNRLENWAKTVGNPSIYLKAILTGELNPEIDLDLEILQERLQEHCACGLLINRTRSGDNFARLLAERTVKGEFVRTMQARLQKANEQDKRQLERALVYGLMAFEQREILPGK